MHEGDDAGGRRGETQHAEDRSCPHLRLCPFPALVRAIRRVYGVGLSARVSVTALLGSRIRPAAVHGPHAGSPLVVPRPQILEFIDMQ
ncbi:hypothetical protein GCM10009651_10660 [Microbacterium natoriense]